MSLHRGCMRLATWRAPMLIARLPGTVLIACALCILCRDPPTNLFYKHTVGPAITRSMQALFMVKHRS